jgi:hypothetical protein
VKKGRPNQYDEFSRDATTNGKRGKCLDLGSAHEYKYEKALFQQPRICFKARRKFISKTANERRIRLVDGCIFKGQLCEPSRYETRGGAGPDTEVQCKQTCEYQVGVPPECNSLAVKIQTVSLSKIDHSAQV